jgi:hypothetical protein
VLTENLGHPETDAVYIIVLPFLIAKHLANDDSVTNDNARLA